MLTVANGLAAQKETGHMSWLGKIVRTEKAAGVVLLVVPEFDSPCFRDQEKAKKPLQLTDRGHTLMEIVIVMAVVAILAGFAYPRYHRTVLKSHRIDATSSLLRVQLAQARYRTEHAAYASRLDDLGWPSPALSERGYYQIKLDSGVNPEFGFRAIAIPAPGSDQVHDSCSRFVVDANGPDRMTSSGPDCWD